MSDALYYVYAVARPFPAEDVQDVAGVGESAVELIAYEDLVAVVSPVPPEEFGESALKASLEDIAWLERVARAHNEVVNRVAQLAVVLPFRLATIYWDDDRVREVLAAGRDRLSREMDRLEQRVEWGVKVFAHPRSHQGTSGTPTKADSGRSYLRQRLRHRDEREDGLRRAEETALTVDQRLAELAEGRFRHRTQSAELTGSHGDNVFNAAYLVPVDEGRRFADELDRLRESHPECRIELTGPWVPYSFALDHVPEGPGHD